MGVKDSDDFASRVNYASRVIASGASTSRGFDDCFEMNDGDAVAVAVYRRSLKSPALAANIWRYLSQNSVMESVEQFAQVTNMTREAARQRSNATNATREAAS